VIDRQPQTSESKRAPRPEWAEGLSEQLRKGQETIVRSRRLLARLDALLAGEVPPPVISPAKT
jgi:hypothetical protein